MPVVKIFKLRQKNWTPATCGLSLPSPQRPPQVFSWKVQRTFVQLKLFCRTQLKKSKRIIRGDTPRLALPGLGASLGVLSYKIDVRFKTSDVASRSNRTRTLAAHIWMRPRLKLPVQRRLGNWTVSKWRPISLWGYVRRPNPRLHWLSNPFCPQQDSGVWSPLPI